MKSIKLFIFAFLFACSFAYLLKCCSTHLVFGNLMAFNFFYLPDLWVLGIPKNSIRFGIS